jgi:hypothetical protein
MSQTWWGVVPYKENPNSDIRAFEREINREVYHLYGLTEEEIKIVEGTN